MKTDVTSLSTLMGDYVLPFIGICAWLILGFWASSFASRLLHARLSRRIGPDTSRAVSQAVKFALLALFVFTLIYWVGVDVKAVLGTAGIAGVAIGFASQTSLSNLISGLFLVLEHPFKSGDWIEVDGTSGYVHGVGLQSTYIRTFDNRMVRIPNEVLAKSKLINYTQYPIRRLDLDISVSCKEDVGRVMQIFRDVVVSNPSCFNEPEPVILLKGFSEASLDFMVAVWADRNELQTTRSSLLRDIKEHFDRAGIELPYQRLAAVTERQPVQNHG